MRLLNRIGADSTREREPERVCQERDLVKLRCSTPAMFRLMLARYQITKERFNMTMQEQQAICETCDHRVNNPDPGWCYMMDSPLVGCMQYVKFSEDNYLVDCCNEDCGWSGLSGDCSVQPHSPEELLCPECHEVVEPVAESV